ncbi:DNA-binding protein [Aquimarina atlantica]|uniref:DNA-binding protein n=1 Tax=Aquimarina atlantica TaxID=1317122 RepID=A0A023BWE1_9FLAO|nr:AraC family transcriptional regulator [Aquimarina atlantica]EZH74305.1 DNA-binding protein [Aquimarina atlantica]
MKTVTLPIELTSDKHTFTNLYYYQSTREHDKQQIKLTKNVFSFLIDGQKEVFTNNSSFLIENSSFLLMKLGHCLMTEKLSPIHKNYKSVLLFFSNEEILQFVQKFDIKTSNNTISQSAYSFQYDQFIKNYVNSLVDISRLSPSIQRKMIQAKFEEIMIYLAETNGTDFISSMMTHQSNSLQNFLSVVENNKLRKMTLKELAFLSNMSVSTFKREFEKHFQESPSKWFLDKRLEHSAFILKNKAKRPSEIYQEVGYENLSNFIHAFKAKFGVTPKQYQLN